MAAWAGLAGAQTVEESSLAPVSLAAKQALVRQRDAQTALVLSAEGQALLARDVVQLDGYAYCGRALALAEQGELRLSIRAAAKALHLGEAGSNQDLQAVAQRDLAIAYSYAGLLSEAQSYAQAALALQANDPAQAHAPAHKVLGDVAARRGEFSLAVASYEASLNLATARFKPLVQMSLANAYTQQAQGARALEILKEIPKAEAAQLGNFYQRSQANALLANQQTDAAGLLLANVVRGASGSDAAYHRLWAHEGLARVALARGDQAAALKAYLEAVDVADVLRSKFQSGEFKTGLFGNLQAVFDQALALSLQTQNFEAAWNLSEASRARQFLDAVRERSAEPVSTPRSNLKALQAALAGNEAVLQFHVLADKTQVWWIRRDQVVSRSIGISEAALTKQVEALRASVVERRRESASLAQGLYKTLLSEVNLEGAQRVFVVPHGPLHYLPFQVLHNGSGYLIERAALAVWPSSAIGLQLLGKTAQDHAVIPSDAASHGASLLGFGNPATDRNVPLPGAEREVQQIAKQFGRSAVFVQRDATKRRFAANEARANVLHVAAHAELDEVDPLHSRILFAASGQDSGLLEARDILGLNLQGVKLVTLSACESGLGKVLHGDEIVGFTRSFLSAGASSIVASLWPVSDDSTDLLMNRLYQDLASGNDLMTSMQQAQLAVQKNRRFAHPFFWAPFNVIGHGRLQLRTNVMGQKT
jgi:CHAT domain-containing protein